MGETEKHFLEKITIIEVTRAVRYTILRSSSMTFVKLGTIESTFHVWNIIKIFKNFVILILSEKVILLQTMGY